MHLISPSAIFNEYLPLLVWHKKYKSTPNRGSQERNEQVAGATITRHDKTLTKSAGISSPHLGHKKRQPRSKGSRQAAHGRSPAAAAAVVKARKKRKAFVNRKRGKPLVADMNKSSTVLSSSVAMKDGGGAGRVVMNTVKDDCTYSRLIYCRNSCIQARCDTVLSQIALL